MPRAVWTGWISFGLVSIPVRLYPATVHRDPRFHEFARESGRRVRHRRVVEGDERSWAPDRWVPPDGDREADLTGPNPEESARSGGEAQRAATPPPAPAGPTTAATARPDIDYGDVVKGYEVEPGRYVMLERDELEALRPTADRTIHIEGFVRLEDIDPVSFEKSYYVGPGYGPGVDKAYGLLHAALDGARRVAVGRFVMRTRQYLAAIRPMEGVLGLETLYFADEVRPPSEILPGGLPGGASDRELKLAGTLIDVLAMEWDPAAFPDTHRERVMDLIQSKAAGAGTVVEEEPAVRPEVADLMAALRASVEEAKGRRTKPAKKRRASG